MSSIEMRWAHLDERELPKHVPLDVVAHELGQLLVEGQVVVLCACLALRRNPKERAHKLALAHLLLVALACLLEHAYDAHSVLRLAPVLGCLEPTRCERSLERRRLRRFGLRRGGGGRSLGVVAPSITQVPRNPIC